MKLSKTARAELRLMSATDKKKVITAVRTLLQARLIGPKFATMISRNYKA